MIVIDYLQLMQVPGSRENRATEISEISRGLKALAKELHVPVVALSQLNRSLNNARTTASDVRFARVRRYRAGCGYDRVHLPRRVYDKDSPIRGSAEIISASSEMDRSA